jgi:hypothetical protein
MEISEEAICGNAYFTNLDGALTNLICDLPPDHAGDHADHRHGEVVTWEALGVDPAASGDEGGVI